MILEKRKVQYKAVLDRFWLFRHPSCDSFWRGQRRSAGFIFPSSFVFLPLHSFSWYSPPASPSFFPFLLYRLSPVISGKRQSQWVDVSSARDRIHLRDSDPPTSSMAQQLLTSNTSPVSRSYQALHAPPSGGGSPRDQGALQPEVDVDRCMWHIVKYRRDGPS